MKSDLPLPAPTLQNFFVKNFLFLVDGFPKLDFIGWDGNLQQRKVKSAVKPNRMPSILQMLTPMTTMHCCHCNDDWEGHYHYVDAASDANPWVVTRQSLIQYQNFCRLSLFSWKIASSQKCRKFCHQVQLTNLEGREGTFANTLHYCIFCNIFWIYGHSQSHFCDIASTILTSSSLDLLFGHFFIESAKFI